MIDFTKMPTKAKTKVVAKASPFDLEAAKKRFEPYEKQIQKIKQKMDDFIVDSDKSVALCTEAVAKSARLIKDMEEERKHTIKNPDKFVRAVNRFVKNYRDQVDGIVKSGKTKIGNYEYKKELKRREKEAEAAKTTAKLQAEIDRKAKEGGYEPVQMPAMVAPRSEGPVRTESGTASTMMVWTFEIEQEMEVPRDYLVVDKKLVEAAIKAGIREIPGIRIYEQPTVRIRTS
jgi:hypothetical protein